MAKFTICPHFLVDYQLTDPKTIEREIINPLLKCLISAKKKGITLVLSKEIMTHFIYSYPWNLMSDPQWSGYVRIWNETITQHINKAKFVSVESFSMLDFDNCSLIQTNVKEMFARFLTVFGTNSLPNNLHEEGIFVGEHCNYPSTLNQFILFSLEDKLWELKFPWLRIYNKPLPFMGDCPFIPPTDWRTLPSPRRGNNHGYIDDSGNEWKWDRLHDDHWDVQHSDRLNDYTNVTSVGVVLS